jgi:hypothetical protein
MSPSIAPRRPGVFPLLAVGTAGALALASCTSSEVDPRLSMDVPYEHQAQIAQFINGSDLWQAYLDYLSPDGTTPVVEIYLGFERRITQETSDGDYDPGIVYASLEMTNLVSGRSLATADDSFAIKDFVIGDLKDASRDEIQDAAFAATEQTAVRFVLRSLEVGIIQGMRDEGTSGTPFIPVLEKTAADEWAGDMAGMAKGALKVIRGS